MRKYNLLLLAHKNYSDYKQFKREVLTYLLTIFEPSEVVEVTFLLVNGNTTFSKIAKKLARKMEWKYDVRHKSLTNHLRNDKRDRQLNMLINDCESAIIFTTMENIPEQATATTKLLEQYKPYGVVFTAV